MKKTVFIKSLLLSAVLTAGASAWGRTITYDFKSDVNAGGITASSLSKGTNAGKNNGTDIFFPVQLTSELQNRFAFQYREKNGSTNAWAVEKSRNGLWVNCASGVDEYMSILNLKANDVVKISIATGKLKFSNTVNAKTSDNTTPDAWSYVESDKEYTIIADGKLDLQAMKYQNGGNAHMAISKIVIETSDVEIIETNPTISVTGANGGAREITITTYNTSADNGTTAYFTLDGKTPSAASTVYTSAFNISANDDNDNDGIVVVNAISYKTGDTSIASSVSTINVPVGTSVLLNAPEIHLTAFTANGAIFNPTYTFTHNQNDVIGAPAATLSYSFNDGAVTPGSSYTVTSAGTLRVTVSAEGYASNYTEIPIANANFLKTYVFDATKDISINDGAPTTYTNYSISGKGCNLYALSNCTFSTLKNISFDSNMQFAWAVTADEAYCLFARLNKSTVMYNLEDGEYIEFTSFGTPIIASSSTNSTTLAWYSSIRQINVYTPVPTVVSVSAAVTSSTGYATFSSTYALDFTGITTLTAYTATACNGTNVTLTPVSGTVAANTGLVIKGTTTDIPVVATGDTQAGNLLVGCSTNTNITPSSTGINYVLSVQGSPEKAVFAPVTGDAATVTAGHAYLYVPNNNSARTLNIVFSDEASGINAVESAKVSDGQAYNIAGQRVAQPTKGLYIVNGKKVIIK